MKCFLLEFLVWSLSWLLLDCNLNLYQYQSMLWHFLLLYGIFSGLEYDESEFQLCQIFCCSVEHVLNLMLVTWGKYLWLSFPFVAKSWPTCHSYHFIRCITFSLSNLMLQSLITSFTSCLRRFTRFSLVCWSHDVIFWMTTSRNLWWV